jgi:hypothetical protein
MVVESSGEKQDDAPLEIHSDAEPTGLQRWFGPVLPNSLMYLTDKSDISDILWSKSLMRNEQVCVRF